VDNFSTLGYLIVGTQRVATMHWRMAEHFARHLPVVIQKMPIEMPLLIETMVWPRHMGHDPANAWLRQRLGELASALPKPSVD